MKFLIWVACIVYCLSPIDIAPGPLDDAIVTIAVMGLTSLMSSGNKIDDK